MLPKSCIQKDQDPLNSRALTWASRLPILRGVISRTSRASHLERVKNNRANLNVDDAADLVNSNAFVITVLLCYTTMECDAFDKEAPEGVASHTHVCAFFYAIIRWAARHIPGPLSWWALAVPSVGSPRRGSLTRPADPVGLAPVSARSPPCNAMVQTTTHKRHAG